MKYFTKELVDQEKIGYKKAYEWYGKQLEKMKGNSQMHQINSITSAKLPSVAKFNKTIFFWLMNFFHQALDLDIGTNRYQADPKRKKKKSERKTQTNYKPEEKG